MIKNITADNVRLMTDSEGLVLQGCGGNPQEWLDGINDTLTEAGILINGGKFTDISVFEHDGHTNILFHFDDSINPETLNMGTLAMWRLQTHETFGGTWLSDYLTNRLGVDVNAPAPWTIRAEYCYEGENKERVSEVIDYPARQEKIDQLLKNAGIDGLHERIFYIERLETVIPGLDDALPDTGLDTGDLNRLAKAIRIMTEAERDKFSAYIAAGKHCGDTEKIINFAENIDAVEFDPHTAKPALHVYIENVHDNRIGGFTMPLPSTLADLQPFLESTEITGWQDIEIAEVMSDIDGLGDLLGGMIAGTMSKDALDELNYLAANIAEMGSYEFDIFSAVIETKLHCGSVAEIINIAENLSCFDLQPAFSAEQYGEFLLDMEYDYCVDAVARLEKSEDTAERALLKHLTRLEGAADAEKYGYNAAKEEGGVFTKHGYLTEKESAFNEIYRGPEDIPAEHRIFTEPGEAGKRPMKLDDADIAATVMTLYAACHGSMDFAADNLRKLLNGRDNEYLLLVNRSDVRLAPVTEAYKRGTETSSYISFAMKTAADRPDTFAFAVRVTGRGENGVRGDLVELNGKALCANIERHAVIPDRIDAVFSNGAEKSYDLWSWSELPQHTRSEVRDYTAHFTDDGLSEANKRYFSFMGANETVSEAVGMDVFLPAVNAAYMAAAENLQPDMLRIASEAAKEILARGEADVYRLTPNGAEKLAAIESMRPLCFAEHKELAIKREDAGALDKWAERAVKNAIRQAERGERHKETKTPER